MLLPDMRLKKVTDISVEMLKKNKIEVILLDSDNTLIDLDKKPLDGVKEWIQLMKENNIKICILSNSIKKKKVEKIAKYLKVPYIYFAIKPTKIGFNRAKKLLNIKENSHIAEVGDQIFTDVLGTKRMKMFSILTEPICEEKVKLNNIKRKIEKHILKKYKAKEWEEKFKCT